MIGAHAHLPGDIRSLFWRKGPPILQQEGEGVALDVLLQNKNVAVLLRRLGNSREIGAVHRQQLLIDCGAPLEGAQDYLCPRLAVPQKCDLAPWACFQIPDRDELGPNILLQKIIQHDLSPFAMLAAYCHFDMHRLKL